MRTYSFQGDYINSDPVSIDSPYAPIHLVTDRFNQTINKATDVLELLIGTDGSGGLLGEMDDALGSSPSSTITAEDIDTSLTLAESGLSVPTFNKGELQSAPDETYTAPTLVSVPTVDVDFTGIDLPDDISVAMNWAEASLPSEVYNALKAQVIDALQHPPSYGTITTSSASVETGAASISPVATTSDLVSTSTTTPDLSQTFDASVDTSIDTSAEIETSGEQVTTASTPAVTTGNLTPVSTSTAAPGTVTSAPGSIDTSAVAPVDTATAQGDIESAIYTRSRNRQQAANLSEYNGMVGAIANLQHALPSGVSASILADFGIGLARQSAEIEAMIVETSTKISLENRRMNQDDIRIAHDIRRINQDDIRIGQADRQADQEDHKLFLEAHRVNQTNRQLDQEDHKLTRETRQLDQEDVKLAQENRRLGLEDVKLTQENRRLAQRDVELSNEASRVFLDIRRADQDDIRIGQGGRQINQEDYKLWLEAIRISQEERKLDQRDLEIGYEGRRLSQRDVELSQGEARVAVEARRADQDDIRIGQAIRQMDQEDRRLTIDADKIVFEKRMAAIQGAIGLEQLIRQTRDGESNRAMESAKALQTLIVQEYAEKIRAFQAVWEGKKAEVQAKSESVRAAVATNTGLIDVFKAQYDALKTRIEAATSYNKSLTDVFSAEVQGFVGAERAVADRNDSAIKLLEQQISDADMDLRAQIAEAGALIQAYTSEASIKERIAESRSQIAAQVAASLLSAVHAGASIGYSGSEGATKSYSVAVHGSESHSAEHDPAA
jgi:hypothetical protein